ncbi:MAG TPA: type VI secretion system tip protein TssI/VgrG [Pirellulales bacterium]|nr:type VI secretion system tip protein TssI/VgrG [Pirellulales bacterium]
MSTYTQASHPLEVQTPLGKDALLLVGFHGREAISELFKFDLEMITPKASPAAFDKIIGQSVTVRVTLADNSKRYFHGIVRRFSEGRRDDTFLHYRAEVVPQFWLWTKKVETRAFQHLTVPDILKQVLQGLDVSFQLRATYYPRDYCVQYRESDFDFACRLMEDEGIFYFFQHAQGKHTLVLGDDPSAHPEVPQQPKAVYDEVQGGTRPDLRVGAWTRSQELRSGTFTLRDYSFELPSNNLQAQQTIIDQVQAGKIAHKFRLNGNDKLEVYHYPGGYAERFDGIDKGGGDATADLQKVFQDNQRTARVRMEQEAAPGLVLEGSGNIGHFLPGHRFKLDRHYDADGDYVLTLVQHSAQLGEAYRSGQDGKDFRYRNSFTCIPRGLPYRPPRVTPKPTLQGPQTAVVVGPPGEEVFCDKYGRVKVQFHWDRHGKKNADSSCWIRVGQYAAGAGFGALSLPRVGQEVIVAFLEGDPDRPIIVGAVYNEENMPPYKLPEQRTFAGVVHRSHRGATANASELRFESALGKERMLLHAETDLHQNVENNQHVKVGKFHSEIVGVKVPWDKGSVKAAKTQTAAASGAGGGGHLPAPELSRPFDGSATGPVDPEATGFASRMSSVSLVLNSGAGGGIDSNDAPDPKDDDSSFQDDKGDAHSKIRLVMKGSDDTIDDQGKTTYVRHGNVTVIHGGSYTRIFKEPDTPAYENYINGLSGGHTVPGSWKSDANGNPVWVPPKTDSSGNPLEDNKASADPMATDPDTAAWQKFPYSVELSDSETQAALNAVASTTEIWGGSRTSISAGSPDGVFTLGQASTTDYFGDVTTHVHGPPGDGAETAVRNTNGGAGSGTSRATIDGDSHTDIGGHRYTHVQDGTTTEIQGKYCLSHYEVGFIFSLAAALELHVNASLRVALNLLSIHKNEGLKSEQTGETTYDIQTLFGNVKLGTINTHTGLISLA